MNLVKIPWQWPKKLDDKSVALSILDNPSSQLSQREESFEKIVQEVDEVVSKSFGVCLEGCDSAREHLLGVDLISIVYKEKILGFASAKVDHECKLFYLHGVVIDPEIKGFGIGTLLIKSLLEKEDIKYISFTTQNPIMFLVSRSLCNDFIFPSPDSTKISIDILKMAQKIAKEREGVFNEQTFVIEDLYKKCLYKEIPRVSDEDVQQWFEKGLCFDDKSQSNHGFLFIGKSSR